MTLSKNTAMISAQAFQYNSLFAGGKLRVYSGVRPSDSNDPPAGDLLAEINIPTPAFVDNADGTVDKTGTWSAIAGDSGTATWARMLNSAETIWCDLDVAESAADLVIDDEDVVTGNAITVNSLTITIPDGN